MSTPVPPPGLYREPPLGAPAFLPTPVPQASDPAVLSNGQVLQRPVVPAPSGEGGAFSIDLERAPQVLRDLEDAREQLFHIQRDATRLGRVDPQTNDEVSRDAAALLGAVAVGGPGSLVAALDAGMARLSELITAIKSELASYQSTDEGVSGGFGEILP